MKVKIITTIVEEHDVQLKDFDRIEGLVNHANRTVKEWAQEVFECPAVETTYEQHIDRDGIIE